MISELVLPTKRGIGKLKQHFREYFLSSDKIEEEQGLKNIWKRRLELREHHLLRHDSLSNFAIHSPEKVFSPLLNSGECSNGEITPP